MLAVGIVLNNLAAFLVAMLLFAAMFKVLPDAEMAWRDVWVGAAMTALLFVIGKALIGWYVQHTDLATGWGSAAASMIGVLVWLYYSCLILLFGAELTQVWASKYGQGIEPSPGAVPAEAHGQPQR
jgi:membrane protein